MQFLSTTNNTLFLGLSLTASIYAIYSISAKEAQLEKAVSAANVGKSWRS